MPDFGIFRERDGQGIVFTERASDDRRRSVSARFHGASFVSPEKKKGEADGEHFGGPAHS